VFCGDKLVFCSTNVSITDGTITLIGDIPIRTDHTYYIGNY
jgi:hypothetical protein